MIRGDRNSDSAIPRRSTTATITEATRPSRMALRQIGQRDEDKAQQDRERPATAHLADAYREQRAGSGRIR